MVDGVYFSTVVVEVVGREGAGKYAIMNQARSAGKDGESACRAVPRHGRISKPCLTVNLSSEGDPAVVG